MNNIFSSQKLGTKVAQITFYMFCHINLINAYINTNLNDQESNDLSEIETQVQEEIDDQLADLICNQISAENEVKKHEKEIALKVNQEIKKQYFRTEKNYTKNKVYGNTNLQALPGIKDDYFIYKLPSWPFHSLFFMQKDIVQLDLSLDFATKSYSSGGSTQDLSRLVFGDKQIQLQDILLASKLVKKSYF